jgi:hypothetical protein
MLLLKAVKINAVGAFALVQVEKRCRFYRHALPAVLQFP